MYKFRFEDLDCFKLALEVADYVDSINPRRGQANIYDQTLRAAQSVVMNTALSPKRQDYCCANRHAPFGGPAEGASRDGNAAINHFRIAQGSAGEALGGLFLLRCPGAGANQDKLRRIGAMLTRVIQTWR